MYLNSKVRLRVKSLILCAQVFACVFGSLFRRKGSFFMSENRIAVISIIIEDRAASAQINKILSDYGDYAVGRMGIPYRQKDVSVLCVVVDAPTEIINQITGKIGMIKGVSAKTVTSKK